MPTSHTTANYSLLTANSTAAFLVPPVPLIQHSTFSIQHRSHTFSAKERDSETGLSYFGSRYYSSDLSIWLSVDPMSDKYAYQSGYVYCGNNPIKVIDPNGEDEWDLSRDGYLTKRENGRTDIDVIHATDKKGNPISRIYKAGTLKYDPENHYEGTIYKGEEYEDNYTTHFLPFSDKETATDFFEFAAENSDVEWAMKSSPSEIVVGTSHKNGYNVVKDPVGMTENIHSHPDKPYNYIGSDHNVAENAYNNGVVYKVYEAGKRSYATYNPEHKALDGPREISKNLTKCIKQIRSLLFH